MRITKRGAGGLLAAMLLATACSGGAATTAPTSAPTDAQSSDAPSSAEPTTSGEWTPEYVDGVLQPLPDGFPSEPITLIVVDDAGSDDGLFARAVQSAGESISPVRINVSDRPDLGSAYGTFEAVRYVAEQPGGTDGYAMVIATQTGSVFDLLTTPIAQDFDVDVDDINWVANTEAVPWVIISRTGAPWGDSFESMIEYCQENPGEIRYISRGPGASVNTAFNQYMNSAGCDVNEIVVVIGAGEGDVAISIVGVTLPVIEDGRAVLLACTGNTNPCPGDWGRDVPTAGSVAGVDPDPWGSTRGYAIPREVDDAHRAWLTELVLKINEDPAFQENRLQLPGLSFLSDDHDASAERSRNLLSDGFEVLSEIGGLDPSVTEAP
jgi:tripartite-type tricarboxylate transporter receptor subunit TctC